MTSRPAEPTILEFLKSTPVTVRYLLLGALVNQMGLFVQVYLIVFMLARGFTVIEAGWALAMLGVGAITGTLLAAPIAERTGERNLIVLSSVALAASVAAVPFATRVDLPAAIWGSSIFVAGLFLQMYRPEAAAILSEHIGEEHHVMGFSLFRIALNVGAAIGPVIATFLANRDWTDVFWFNALCSLAFGAIAWAKLPRDDALLPRSAGAVEGGTAVGSWRQVLSDAKFMAFLGAMLLSSVVYVQVYSTLPAAIQARNFPLTTYSTVLTVYAGVLICCELKVSSITRRYPAWIPATIGTTILCLAIASFGVTLASPTTTILSAVLLVSGLMISGPIMFAYPAKFPKAVKGKCISLTQAAFSIGNAIGPVVGTFLFQRFGGLVWAMCFVAAVISGGLVAAGMRPDVRRPDKPGLASSPT